jgi:anti-sigma-K factor RskA
MTCEELRDDYELHALGLLEEPERMELEDHLRRGCTVCTQGLRRAIAFNTGIVALVPDVSPPARLRKRVLASVGAEQSNWGWLSAWGLATAALLICTLWLSVEERRRSGELESARSEIAKSHGQLAQVQAALALLNEPEAKQVTFGGGQTQPPRGRFFIHKDRGVLLLAANLPPVPVGKTYELWVIPKGGAPKPAGLFQSDASGNVMYLSSGPIDASTTAVAVSVEPEAGSNAPTTTPLIVAPVAD